LFSTISISGFPDPLDLATGIEKKEMLLRLAGNDVSLFKHIVKHFFLLFYYIYNHLTNSKIIFCTLERF